MIRIKNIVVEIKFSIERLEVKVKEIKVEIKIKLGN